MVLILSATTPCHISASRGAESFHDVTTDSISERRGHGDSTLFTSSGQTRRTPMTGVPARCWRSLPAPEGRAFVSTLISSRGHVNRGKLNRLLGAGGNRERFWTRTHSTHICRTTVLERFERSIEPDNRRRVDWRLPVLVRIRQPRRQPTGLPQTRR